MRTDDRERESPPPEPPAPPWRKTWEALALPPAAPAPPGFAARVVARALAEEGPALGLPLSPGWARAAAALALAAGIAGGAGLGLAAERPAAEEATLEWSSSTLAEEYLEEAGTLVEGASSAAAEEER